MGGLPAISGKRAVKVLRKVGYVIDRQKGSHIILRKMDYPFRRLTIIDHKTLAKGTLRSIIKQAGLTISEFLDLM